MKPSQETLIDRLRDIYPNKYGTVVTPRPSPICKEAADEIERLRALVNELPDYEFKLGDKVEKHTGDYKLAGIVVGHAVTLKGDVRYVVEHQPLAPGVLHIYSAKNIRLIES